MRNIDWSKVPEELKVYDLVMTDGKNISIDGNIKAGVMASKSHFIEIGDGTTINKACIVGIYLNPHYTTSKITKGLIAPDGTYVRSGMFEGEDRSKKISELLTPYMKDGVTTGIYILE